MEFQTHHLSDTRQEPKYSVLFGETCGELTKSLLGSYMWHPTYC